MKIKVPTVFKLGTCESVSWSYIHCTTGIDIKNLRYKLFYNALKSPCCDVLSYKVEVTGCRGSLKYQFQKSFLYKCTFFRMLHTKFIQTCMCIKISTKNYNNFDLYCMLKSLWPILYVNQYITLIVDSCWALYLDCVRPAVTPRLSKESFSPFISGGGECYKYYWTGCITIIISTFVIQCILQHYT